MFSDSFLQTCDWEIWRNSFRGASQETQEPVRETPPFEKASGLCSSVAGKAHFRAFFARLCAGVPMQVRTRANSGESAPFIRQPAGIWVELCFELSIHESRFTVHGNKPDPHPPAGGLALLRMTTGAKVFWFSQRKDLLCVTLRSLW